MVREWVGDVDRAVLALVLLWAGIAKARDPRTFVHAASALVPGRALAAIRPLLRALPALEIGVGLAIASSRFSRPGLLAAGGLLILFDLVLLRARRMRLTTPCACFGTTQDSAASVVTLARTLLLTFGALLGVILSTGSAPASLLMPHPHTLAVYPAAVLLVSAGAAFLTAARLLVDLEPTITGEEEAA